MRRGIGENDPGRYEVSILIGPCTEAEALALVEEVHDFCAPKGFGAVLSLETWDEEGEAAPGAVPGAPEAGSPRALIAIAGAGSERL